jgi:hypothetical protein
VIWSPDVEGKIIPFVRNSVEATLNALSSNLWVENQINQYFCSLETQNVGYRLWTYKPRTAIQPSSTYFLFRGWLLIWMKIFGRMPFQIPHFLASSRLPSASHLQTFNTYSVTCTPSGLSFIHPQARVKSVTLILAMREHLGNLNLSGCSGFLQRTTLCSWAMCALPRKGGMSLWQSGQVVQSSMVNVFLSLPKTGPYQMTFAFKRTEVGGRDLMSMNHRLSRR